jgi:nucleoside-diphosphate-sugar epimerase
MPTATGAGAPARDLLGRRVLITGGSGFLGSHLCDHLVGAGARVGVLSRTKGLLENTAVARRVAFLLCDLTEGEQSIRAIEEFGPEMLVHLASHPDGREDLAQAEAAVRLNTIATLNALEGFRRGGGEFFVYGDSTKVYGNCEVPYREWTPLNPTSSYAIAKVAGRQLCTLYAHLYSMKVCSVRPTLVYGARQRLNLFSHVARCVHRGDAEIRLEGGEQTRDPLYIDDAVDAYVATLRAGPHVAGRDINIGGGREYTVAELARMVVQVLGGRQQVVCLPGRARPTEIWRSWCDGREAGELIGWAPRVDVMRGLYATLRGEETPASALAS